MVLIDQSAWPSTWWTVEHWWNSKNNGLRTGALFFSFPRLALRARVVLRAKYRVCPAWLIKRLSCRLLCFKFITISQHLEFRVKIQNDPNKQISWLSLGLHQNNTGLHCFGGSYSSAISSYMLHIPNSTEENCVKEKQIRHYVWKAFDRHVFGPSQNRWSWVYYVMHMISTQIGWRDPWWWLRQVVRTSLDFI